MIWRRRRYEMKKWYKVKKIKINKWNKLCLSADCIHIEPCNAVSVEMKWKTSMYVCMIYVLVYTPSRLRVLRVFQNQYKQLFQNHPVTPQ